MIRIIRLALIALLSIPLISSLQAQSQLQDIPGAYYAMSHEPSMMMRAEGFEYDHEILVALPASYHAQPEREYPVLWVTDGALLYDMAVGIASMSATGNRIPEIIIVGVGHRREEGLAGLAKRTYDFFPPGSRIAGDGPAEEFLDELYGDAFDEVFKNVKGDKFVDFLVDQARPKLTEKYRMEEDHALFGHSAGGAFTGYAMFARPGAFSRFIIGSGTNALTLDMEAAYASENDDMRARVFVGAGDLEANNLAMSAQRIVGRTVLFAENLLLRRYPSMAIETRLYRDEDHMSVIPLIIDDGVKFIYADLAANIPEFPY